MLTLVTYSLYTYADRPDLGDIAFTGTEIWPEYNLHGDVTNEYWGALWDELAEFQVFMIDDQTSELVAELQTAPVWWDGTSDGLGSGVDESLIAAVTAHREQTPVNTLCAFAAKISRAARGQGLAADGVNAMRDLASVHGLGHLIAPVRPSFKDRYPTVPIDEYVTWTRDDGLAFDPWIRVHQRVGGSIEQTIPQSLRITGTVAEWESWTRIEFPVDGDFTFPEGLTTVHIDHAADTGLYYEPNVWIVHDV